jgi:hypothetical protein
VIPQPSESSSGKLPILWQISDTEWLLALRRPEPAARKKAGKIVSLVEQLVLPEFGATG